MMEQPLSSSSPDEPNPVDETGLCLLSLDGGGIRGLSTLFILKGLMDRLNHERRKTSLPPAKPCEIFDLIGGTSTGGLIAIMLGRLEMSVDQCISAYSMLMEAVFQEKSRWLPIGWSGGIRAQFDSIKLKEAIEKVISDCGASSTELFNDQTTRGCRVFVCTTAKETTGITRFRSYGLPDELDISATICDAALATSAATGFFDPVSVGARQFVDGALGANNPVEEVEAEASNIWCSDWSELKPLVKCFISVGTGNPGKKAIEDNLLKFLSKTLVDIVTETEKTETKFIARWARQFDEKRFFRFNVDHGLQDVGLAEYKEQGAIEAATDEYLRHTQQKSRTRDCVMNLRQKQNKTDTSFAAFVNEYTIHMVTVREQTATGHKPTLKSFQSLLIFPQCRLLVRNDILSFIRNSVESEGKVRAVLYGLPGVGKSTMARYFAQLTKEDMPILWIPSTSESEIVASFSKYAQQLSSRELGYSNPISIIQERIAELFAVDWLVIFDGLDDPAIDIQQYLFPNEETSKILITTQNQRVASNIVATHRMQVLPLEEKAAENLLDVTISDGSENEADFISTEERVARKEVVQQLGHLPLAIAIVGAVIRDSPITCRDYLSLTSSFQDDLLDENLEFSDYSNSVWKAFEISFQRVLNDRSMLGSSASSMAYFIASFNDSSTLNDCIRICNDFASRSPGSKFEFNDSYAAICKVLPFLTEGGKLHLGLNRLASFNLVMVDSTTSGLQHPPIIEMHSLVKRWLKRRFERNSSALSQSFASTKLWLLGFSLHNDLVRTKVASKRYDHLKSELLSCLEESVLHPQGSTFAFRNPGSAIPFVLEAIEQLLKVIDFLQPAASFHRHRMHQLSSKLRSELTVIFDSILQEIEWEPLFTDFIREAAEQVEYAVNNDSREDDYSLETFFTNTLDAHGCLPIAFKSTASCYFSSLEEPETIAIIKEDVIQNISEVLSALLSQEAFEQIAEVFGAPQGEADDRITAWRRRWDEDVTAVTRCTLGTVFSSLCQPDNSNAKMTSSTIPEGNEETQKTDLIGVLESLFDSNDPRNAFFAMLRCSIAAATEVFLTDSFPEACLETKKEQLRDQLEMAIRRGLGDRERPKVFGLQMALPDTTGNPTFAMLWELAWAARIAGNLSDWIGSIVMNSFSDSIKSAARDGFATAFGNAYIARTGLEAPLSRLNQLVEEVWDYTSSLENLFPNWIMSGWIGSSDADLDDVSEEGQLPQSIQLLNQAREETFKAMQCVYENGTSAAAHDSLLRSLKSVFECREALHSMATARLSQHELNDRTGMAPLLATYSMQDCDKTLRTVYSILGDMISSEHAEKLIDKLEKIENEVIKQISKN